LGVPRAKPVKYSERIAAKILEELANGEPLMRICRGDGMPRPSTVYRWVREVPEFAQAYAVAQVDHAHALFAAAISISDEEVTDSAQARRQASRIQARQHAAGRLLPRVYGQKVEIDVGDRHVPGADEVVDLTELAREVAFMLTRAVHQAQKPTPKREPPLLELVPQVHAEGGQ
jgi:hypothetical protein